MPRWHVLTETDHELAPRMTDVSKYQRGLPGALIAIHAAVGGDLRALAGRLSISVRSLARFMYGHGFPSDAVARGMLIDAADLPKPLFDRLAHALGVDPTRRPAHRGPPVVVQPVDSVAETAALNLAVYVAAEASDVPPGTARTLFAAALDHVASRGLDAATARALLAATSPPKK